MDLGILPFFIYGTARIGEPLHNWIAPLVTESTIALAPNTELMIKPRGTYPYLVRSHRKDTWGDLLLLRRGKLLNDFVRMEQRVGYTVEGVRIEHSIRGLSPFALAFIWRPRSNEDLIPVGHESWLSYNPLVRS